MKNRIQKRLIQVRLELLLWSLFGLALLFLHACTSPPTEPPFPVLQPTFTSNPTRTPPSTPSLQPTFTSNPTRTPLPTANPLPTLTGTPTASPTPLPTPTIPLLLLVGTPFPFQPEPISIENAKRVIELAQWSGLFNTEEGNNLSIDQIEFSPEGLSLVFLIHEKAESDSESGSRVSNSYQMVFYNIEDGELNKSITIAPVNIGYLYLLSTDCQQLAAYKHNPAFINSVDPDPILLFSPYQQGNQQVIQPSTSEDKFGFLVFGSVFWLDDRNGHINYYQTKDGKLIKKIFLDGSQYPIAGNWKIAGSDFNQSVAKGYCRDNGNGNYINSLSFSRDGKYLISIIHKCNVYGVSYTNSTGATRKGLGVARIDLWLFNGAKHLLNLGNPISCEKNCLVGFADDSGLVAVKTDGVKVKIYKVASGQFITEVGNPGATYRNLSFTSDNKVLIAVKDQSIEFWDVQKEELLKSLYIPEEIIHFSLSQDERYIATVNSENLVQIWGVLP